MSACSTSCGPRRLESDNRCVGVTEHLKVSQAERLPDINYRVRQVENAGMQNATNTLRAHRAGKSCWREERYEG